MTLHTHAPTHRAIAHVFIFPPPEDEFAGEEKVDEDDSN